MTIYFYIHTFREIYQLILKLFLLSVISIQPLLSMPLQHGISLAEEELKKLPIKEYFVSEKLDGIRGYWDGKELLSRQGYPITTPKWFTENLGPEPLDGEIWLGRATFQTISSLISSDEPDNPLWKNVTYNIFDMPALNMPFTRRVEYMAKYIALKSPNNPHLKMVPQQKVDDYRALKKKLLTTVRLNGEGLMLHHQDSFYKPYQRNDALIKVKVIDEGCAIITGYNDGKGKYENLLGSLRVKTIINNETIFFSVGSGLTDSLRKNPPEIGSSIRYLHNGLTNNNIPRFPRLKAVNVDSCIFD